ncbi:MAG: HAD-IA family hydrolase [Propionibacteriaceae bacterium]|jgi:phosphoglycolate phosphatase|nr:HAD-IA family hydrolase [Propionibacteriaceae bacterium]
MTNARPATTAPKDRLIICDLDGTLADTLPGIAHSLQGVLRRFGLPEPTLAETRRHIGGGARNLVASVLGEAHADLAGAVLEAFGADYNADPTHGLVLYPGVRETLARLAETTALAVATAKARPATDKCLAHLGIDRFFDAVVTGSEMRAPKPDPGCVFDLLDRLGTPAGRTMVVGDTEADVQTAANAGVAAWVVPYGYGAERLEELGGFDRMVEKFSDITEWSPTT